MMRFQAVKRLQRHPTFHRLGFTLVELLVSISILVLLSVMTMSAFNVTSNEDRIRSAARQVQSMLEGARDRAIYAGEPRGVRFLLDPNDTSTVSSMIYVGAPQKMSGTLYIWIDPSDPTFKPTYRIVTQTAGSGQAWGALAVRGLLKVGARIQIPAKTGLWYPIEALEIDSNVSGSADTTGEDWLLDNDLWDLRLSRALADIPNGETTYLLEIEPAVLPNQEPVTFPSGIVIDLDNGKLPSDWFEATGDSLPDPPFRFGQQKSSNPVQMDLLFAPRGGVSGSLASQGIIHFVLADIADTTRNLPLIDVDADTSGEIDEEETSAGDRRITTIFTRTGHIATSPIYQDTNDPFRYAETGEEID